MNGPAPSEAGTDRPGPYGYEDRAEDPADRSARGGDDARMTAAGRVDLRPMSLADLPRLLGGGRALDWHPQYPLTETLIGLEMLRSAHTAAGWGGRRIPAWWMYEIVVAGTVAGDIGFHGPPPPAGSGAGELAAEIAVEVGYDVVPALRGCGVATAACRQIVALAWADGADVVTAEVEPGPYAAASAQVLTATGFTPRPANRWMMRRAEGRPG